MTRATAVQLNLRPLGVFRSYAVVGVPPQIMGIGPAVAIPAAVSKAGLELGDVDVFELNEAFASQAAYCIKVSFGAQRPFFFIFFIGTFVVFGAAK